MSELPVKDNKLTIKAITYETHATPLVLKDYDIPVQDGEKIVKPTEVLVKVKAVALNPVDSILKQLSNRWFGPKTKIAGGDFAGVVVKAGVNSGYKVGDRLYGDVFSATGRGSFANYILFEPSKVPICEKIPEGMSYDEASSLACVSNTAFICLSQYKGDLKDKNVLVLGAGTSVGFFAVQFAKHYFGASNVVATCSSKSSQKTTNAGADFVIDYKKGNDYKLSELKKFAAQHGKFDIICDCVRDETVMDIFDDILKPSSEGGIFSQVAGSYTLNYENLRVWDSIPSWKFLKNSLLSKLGLAKYSSVTIFTARNPNYGPAIEKLYKEGNLKIVIDSKYDAYTQFEEAFKKISTCSAHGKIILEFDKSD
ncbi:hypothetical protein CAS74_004836 [Pichia kudriavzevii]|uniref:Enoyl reductase (ER) domain-containing protein n=1 Tax=Pichia kudriavzevii TaxID=4909 RepID=A0A1Z8JHM7_PICKU|nr:hypothetical protein CAS74_004836 [Pichia kudriavzevii]